VNLASIPSPTTAVWHLGPVPIRAYALCIVAGIIVACLVTEVRMRRRGAPKWAILDIAVWAVPFGIVGARIYHVLTSWSDYFGAGGDPVKALKIWEGGLGIWGAVAGGAIGAWLACRQLRIPLTFVADALAPGLPLSQAVGRLGNWFNNELYGGPTTLPWGLRVHPIDPETGRAETDGQGNALSLPGFYHPAFLYELLWNLVIVVPVVLIADRRFKLGKGRAFALYVMAYTLGRAWIEALRVDKAIEFNGIRFNVWISALVFLGALIYFVRVKGPQEFLVPEGDGFRVVTEDEYAAYQRGELTAAETEAPALVDDDAGGGDAPEAETDSDPPVASAADEAPAAPPADEPVADGPVADAPAADEPVADAPAADEPVAADGTTGTDEADDAVKARSGDDR